MFKTIIPALALTALVAPAFAAENWTTDFPAALKQAAQEKKLALVDFNGSDWCPPCIMLRSQVFDKAAFLAYAKDKFVLVDIDFPRKKAITPQLLKTNQALKLHYGVTNYPTTLVINAQGVVVGGFVGGFDSVTLVQELLNEDIANALKVQVELDRARALVGVEKAKALYAAYQEVPANLKRFNAKLISEIKALDTENSLGIN